jgi:hypothetical protein
LVAGLWGFYAGSAVAAAVFAPLAWIVVWRTFRQDNEQTLEISPEDFAAELAEAEAETQIPGILP